MEKQQKQIQQTAEKLFALLGIQSPFEVHQKEEGFEIILETEENGMLIGYHGETLEALQLILSLCVAKELGEFVRISLEIGEYKKNRMDFLDQLVQRTKEEVLANNAPVQLPNLKSWERRYVHTLLKDDAEVVSESSGEGRERMLAIYPRQ